MDERLKGQPEEKPQAKVKKEFRDYIKGAKKGDPRYRALTDFFNLEKARNPDSLDPILEALYQKDVKDASAKSPAYKEAFQAMVTFKSRFQSAYEAEWTMATEAERIPVRIADIPGLVELEFSTALASLNPPKRLRMTAEERRRRRLLEEEFRT